MASIPRGGECDGPLQDIHPLLGRETADAHEERHPCEGGNTFGLQIHASHQMVRATHG